MNTTNPISYTYKIIKVDVQSRCMEIVYESEGRATQHIGARMPYVGETVEDIVEHYAPIAYWRTQEIDVVEVEPGLTGTVAHTPQTPSLDTAKTAKLFALAAARYAQEVAGVMVNGVTYDTSREARAQLAGVFAAMQAGVMTEAVWKAANGVFVALNAEEAQVVVQAITRYVQECFATEAALSAQVHAASTPEALAEIVWP